MQVELRNMRVLVILILGISLVFGLFYSLFVSDKQVEAATSNDEYKIVGYYPSWGAYGRDFQVTDMDPNKVTHINYAFADVCWDGKHGNAHPESPNPQTWTCQDENGVINVPNGTIVLGDPWIDVQKSFPGDTWDEPIKGNIKQLQKLKEINPDLKTIISVGGWSWSNKISDVAASVETRENFANSAVDFVRKYGFDGVDLDWEYPVGGGLTGNSARPEDKQNHTLLLQAVRDKLDIASKEDNKEYLLTIASSAGPTYVDNNELSKLGEILDWINIMTYDFNGGWQNISAHNAPLYFDQAAEDSGVPNAKMFTVEEGVQGHLDAGVPSEKIVLGTPFYGRGWGGCDVPGSSEYQNCSGPITVGTWENGVFDYKDLEDNYINKNGYQRYWNDQAKVPYLYNPTTKNFISYDDEESFQYKIDFLKSKGLGGAMFWDYSSDRDEVLLDVLVNNLEGPVFIDTEAPSKPTNLTASNIYAKSFRLNWDPSTDNIGVAKYIVTYGQESITVSNPNIVIGGLSPNTSYTVTITAVDGAGNISEVSDAITVTTTELGDQTPPSAPTDLVATDISEHSVELNWTKSTSEIGVTEYIITYGDETVTVNNNNIVINNLAANTNYTFSIIAEDADGNQSAATTINVKTLEESICKGAQWSSAATYNTNDQVVYNGDLYEAKWWNTGENPAESGEWGVWKLVEKCNDSGDSGDNGDGDGEDNGDSGDNGDGDGEDNGDSGDNGDGDGEDNGDSGDKGDGDGEDKGDNCTLNQWDSSTIYTGGEQVLINGEIFEAKWWTLGDTPSTSIQWGPWEFVSSCN